MLRDNLPRDLQGISERNRSQYIPELACSTPRRELASLTERLDKAQDEQTRHTSRLYDATCRLSGAVPMPDPESRKETRDAPDSLMGDLRARIESAERLAAVLGELVERLEGVV